jgi:hypothetical protein
MKKLFLVCVFAIASTNAFAAFDKGFAIGAVGGLGFLGRNNAALALHLPGMPIYWGVALDMFSSGWWSVSVSGDYPVLKGQFLPWFGYFIHAGAYARVSGWNTDDGGIGVSGGVRVPLGLRFIFFKNFLELFVDAAPSLGLGTGIYGHYSSFYFPDFGIPGEVGFRVWL